MIYEEILPQNVLSFKELANKDQSLILIQENPKIYLINSPELVKETLHSKSNSFTRDTELIYWSKLLTYYNFLDLGLFRDLSNRWLKNEQKMIIEESWLTFFQSDNISLDEETIATCMLKYFLLPYGDYVEDRKLAQFHRACFYFEHIRAYPVDYKIAMTALHQQARESLIRDIYNYYKIKDEPDEQTFNMKEKLFSAVIHSAYRSALNLLGWLMFLLSDNRKYQNELSSISDTNILDKELHCFILETLRLFPSAWILGRTAVEHVHLNDQVINKGEEIKISPFCFHRNSKYFHEPLSFKPERFRNPIQNAWTYFPFGNGKFACPGTNIAFDIAKSFLRSLLKTGKVTHSIKATYPVEYTPISLNPFIVFQFSIR